MLQRTFSAGFIAPCLPTKTDQLPSGSGWLHEIKHDGFRIIARRRVAVRRRGPGDLAIFRTVRRKCRLRHIPSNSRQRGSDKRLSERKAQWSLIAHPDALSQGDARRCAPAKITLTRNSYLATANCCPACTPGGFKGIVLAGIQPCSARQG